MSDGAFGLEYWLSNTALRSPLADHMLAAMGEEPPEPPGEQRACGETVNGVFKFVPSKEMLGDDLFTIVDDDGTAFWLKSLQRFHGHLVSITVEMLPYYTSAQLEELREEQQREREMDEEDTYHRGEDEP